MKILDKIKDLFTDEEEVVETAEVEIEKTVEHKLPTFMRKKIEQEEERIKEEKLEENDLISDKDIVKTNTNFSFPVEFNDSDFEVEGYSNQNVLAKEREKTVSELYTKKDEPKPLRFRPTPIISLSSNSKKTFNRLFRRRLGNRLSLPRPITPSPTKPALFLCNSPAFPTLTGT